MYIFLLVVIDDKTDYHELVSPRKMSISTLAFIETNHKLSSSDEIYFCNNKLRSWLLSKSFHVTSFQLNISDYFTIKFI